MLVMLCAAAGAVAFALLAGRPPVKSAGWVYASFACSIVAMVATARVFGPLIMVPVLVVVNALPVIVIRGHA